MHVIDMHCDTLMKGVLEQKKTGKPVDMMDMSGHIDFRRLKKGGYMAQFFAMFMMPEGSHSRMGIPADYDDEAYIADCVELLERNVKAHSDLMARAYSADDIEKNFADGKISAVLTIEDSRPVLGKLENIKRYYDLGVRAMSLTWNFANCMGWPNSKDPEIMGKGLTDFGKEAIVYMQELGILVDVSHLNDGGFYDIAKICKKPFIASHSNARAIGTHQRNLTDEMLRILGEHGGVTGLNFNPPFLTANEEAEIMTADLMAEHAAHIVKVAGEDACGMGTDFDGIGGILEVADCSMMDKLEEAFRRKGMNDDLIEKIACRNVLRVMREAL